jgi:hypothetical protein
MTTLERIDRLVDSWCGARHLDALRIILPTWPIAMNLTDEWARVFEALKAVRGRAAAGFTPAETRELEDVILEVGRVVY